MANLTLKKVNKSYGVNPIVHDINLNVADGKFIVIVGPSGCGKSTLLRLIAGLEELNSGEIYIGDRLVNQLNPKDRDIAMVFQNYALYPHMSVYDNMAYGLRMRGFKRQAIAERVNKAAEVLGLNEVLQRKPSELSGGQRQRVAMGRAIVRKPAVFLYDEPLSNLDAQLRVHMRLEIKRLQQELATTSIYVTHDQVEAMTLADEIVVMNKGRIEQLGSPMELYRQPSSQFVAGFIGSPTMNFLSGFITSDGMAIRFNEHITLPLNKKLLDGVDQEVIVGIRPEHIFAKEKEGADYFDLTIEYVESLGADTMAYGVFADGAHRLTARLPGKWQGQAGTTVSLGVMPDSLHLFDKITKQRIN